MFLSIMTTAEAQCPEIRPDHPRIFFNADTWPSIKERALTDNKKYLDELLKEVDMLPEEPEIPDTRLPEIKDRTIPIDPVKEYGREAAPVRLHGALPEMRNIWKKPERC